MSKESRHALARVGHGKSDASKTSMHGCPDMHGVPYGCDKHRVVSLSTLA